MSTRIKLIFVFIFIFKFLFLFYFARVVKAEPGNAGGYFSYYTGDAFSYVGAMENYINKGTYSFMSGTKTVYAGRMPYYGCVYYLFRKLASPQTTYDLIVILQLVIEVLSIFYLALLAKMLFKSSFAFWFTTAIATLSFNVSYWSLYVLPESLSVSCIVFFLYHYFNFKINGAKRSLFLFALFLSFLILLKPYFISFIVFVFADFYTNDFSFKKTNFSKAVKATAYICTVLLVCLAPWIVRNYLLLNRFIPLQETITAGYNYTEADFACRRFIQSWGGTAGVYWDKRSAACYFTPKPGRLCEYKFPEFVFTKGYSFKDIETVRNKYVILQSCYSDSLNREVTREFDRLTSIFIAEKPLRYYVLSLLEMTKNFLFQSGSYYLPVRNTFKHFHPWQLYVKGVQSLLYYIVLLGGFAGLAILTYRYRSALILIAIPGYIIALFCFYIKVNEFRFFNHAPPVLMIGTTYLSTLFYNYLMTKPRLAKYITKSKPAGNSL